jgi:hypothetical protein
VTFPVQVIEFALPEDIERLRAQKKRDLARADRLEINDDPPCGPTQIEVSWQVCQPPRL